MACPAAGESQRWFCLSSTDTSKQDGNGTSLTRVLNYLLTRYATDNVVPEADDIIVKSKEKIVSVVRSLPNIWDLLLDSGNIYNDEIVRRYCQKSIAQSLYNSMHQVWADIGTATLEDFAHRAQSKLSLHGRNWNISDKEEEKIKVVKKK